MAVLRVVTGPDPRQLIPVEGDRAVIGRHPDCEIVLEVGAISRQHAQIIKEGEEYFIEDLKSRNGTFVNGEAIAGRRKLEENDQIKICEVVFSFHYGQPPLDLPASPTSTEDSRWATLVDDEETDSGMSTIMTSIDVSTSGSGLRVSVNTEGKLKALLEISKSLANSLGEDEVLEKILDGLFRVFPQADRGFIVLRESPGLRLIPRAVKYRRDEQDDTVRISRTIANQVMDSQEALLSADASNDARFSMSESIADFRIRSMMCVPLIDSEGESIGILQIDTLDQRSRFQKDDLDVLASVAPHAAFAIENARRHEASLWRESVERDLALARQVQQGFLPRSSPQVASYQFFNFYEPAKEVGGDFFDYVLLDDNRIGVIVADVSGKGVAAALLMAKVISEARFHLVRESEPSVAINRLSAEFSDHGWTDRFVTFVLALVDCNTHEVTIVNAGHMPPLLRHADGSVEEVGEPITGVPLGVDADWEYEEYRFTLQAGEILTVFTDGFSEAENDKREMYGMDRLIKQVSAPASNAKDLGQRILTDVKRFTGSHPQSDDMCLLCFGRDS